MIYRDVGIAYIEIAGETMEMTKTLGKEREDKKNAVKGDNIYCEATTCYAHYLFYLI